MSYTPEQAERLKAQGRICCRCGNRLGADRINEAGGDAFVSVMHPMKGAQIRELPCKPTPCERCVPDYRQWSGA